MTMMPTPNRTPDHVDTIQQEWQRVLPTVDARAIGITGRISRIALYAEREADDHLRRFRLTTSGVEILSSLHRARPRGLSPTSLAREQNMSSAGITGLLDQLEGMALVARSRDPHDRRRVVLSLSAKGAELVGPAAGGTTLAEGRLRHSLGVRSTSTLHLLVSRLLGTIEPGLDLRNAQAMWCISRIALHIDREADALFQQFGLTHGGFQVLASLYRSGPPYRRSPSGVARGLMLSSAGMTGRMDQLERRGLLRRRRDLDDRRGVVVQLTDGGTRVLPASFAAFVASHQRLLERSLTVAEQSALTRLLHQLLLDFEKKRAG